MACFWIVLASTPALLALISIGLMRLGLLVVTVEGVSMVPTLAPGDRVLVWRLVPSCWLRRGQIILIWQLGIAHSGARLVIKRIIGLPGDQLLTSLDDLPEQERPFQRNLYDVQGQRIWHIPEGHVFVRGDRREGSVDSLIWGPIPLQRVEGIVLSKLSHQTPPP